MDTQPNKRAISSIKAMTDLGIEYGLSLDQCLDSTAITVQDLTDPEAMVTVSQELQVIDNLVRHLPDVKGLGLQAGMRYQLTTLGIWAFAIISSPTLRAAIEVGVRFVDLSHVLAKYDFVEKEDSAEIHIGIEHIPPHLRTFVLERQLATTLLLIREMTGEALMRPRELYLSIGELPFTTLPDILRGTQVHLNSSMNRLVLDKALLDKATPKANPATAAFCVQQCEELLNKRKALSGFSGEVRALLLSHIDAMPSLNEAAKHFHMSPRTFRRRLEENGSHYRELLDETRQGVAIELLNTANLSVESVAERLGYAETASFIHAFKRWTGTTPGQYKKHPR